MPSEIQLIPPAGALPVVVAVFSKSLKKFMMFSFDMEYIAIIVTDNGEKCKPLFVNILFLA
jgi:hypothetical protein